MTFSERPYRYDKPPKYTLKTQFLAKNISGLTQES